MNFITHYSIPSLTPCKLLLPCLTPRAYKHCGIRDRSRLMADLDSSSGCDPNQIYFEITPRCECCTKNANILSPEPAAICASLCGLNHPDTGICLVARPSSAYATQAYASLRHRHARPDRYSRRNTARSWPRLKRKRRAVEHRPTRSWTSRRGSGLDCLCPTISTGSGRATTVNPP